jgi:uncharacterized membrane protein YfcA
MTTFLLIVLLGLAIGVALGLTGVGAGAVLTPALVLLGVRPSVAVGTSLLFSLITKPAGAIQHLRQGTTDVRTVRWLATGSVPAAVASLVLVRTVVPRGVLLDGFTQHALAAALVLVAIVLTLRLTNRLPRRRTSVPGIVLVAVGAVVGVTVALTSVGSGSLALAMLGVLTPLTVAQLVGTDMLHAAILAAVTAPFYVASGNVDVGLALGLGVGSIPGVVLGSRLTVMVPERFTRGTVVAAVWLVALKSL